MPKTIPRVLTFVQNESEKLFGILPEKGLHYQFLIARYTWQDSTIRSIADRYQVSRYRVTKDLKLSESLVLQYMVNRDYEKYKAGVRCFNV